MHSLLGFLTPVFVYGFILILNYSLPGKWMVGYATKEGTEDKLSYRLNGLLVLVIVLIVWALSGYFHILPWDWFYQYRWEGLAGAVVFGLLFSWAVFFRYPPVRKSAFADFYFGRALNLQWGGGRIDAKMWLYLVGAILLELNVLSFAGYHHITFGADASPGIMLSAAMLTYFVFDYLTFEHVHLYTYDLFAERVGFKLGWGCIAFYPFFYSIPLWSTVDLPNPGTPSYVLIIAAVVFLGSWSLARGANLQKYYFKIEPNRKFLRIQPEAISDGHKSLLVNGFWGLSRHINYLGEIGMATGIVLAVGYPYLPWPWLYPLYYIALLVPRQIDDDKRCQLKYGALWDQYEKKVRYRIIPFIY
jgi:protein-S-isoprenylcysteine O-methyltransferase Ste14